MAAKAFLILTFFAPSLSLYAQQNEELDIKEDKPIIKTANRFKPRPKILTLEYGILSNFTVISSSNELGPSAAEVDQNLIRKVKLNFPLILKEKLNLFGGFGYSHEQFKFKDIENTDYPLYNQFEDKPLKKISFKTVLKKTQPNNKFFFLYLNSSLNSDEPQFSNLNNQLKTSIALILGKNPNPNKQYGNGISFGYDLGQPSILPLFIYKNDFSLLWGLELLLPKSVKIRFSPSEAFHFYSFVEIDGASYHLQGDVLDNYTQLEFRRSAVRPGIVIEREVYDWLWVGLESGLNLPLNLFISEPQKTRRDSIIKIDADETVYYNFSLFIVPPTKLYSRAKSR